MISNKLFVIKRGGRKEEVQVDKISSRIQKLCYGLNMDFVDPVGITLKVINGLYCDVTTQELDNLAAETAATLTTNHGDYAVLAARIAVSNLHKETKKVFSEVISDLYHYDNKETGKSSPLISEHHYEYVKKNADRLNSSIIYDRDFGYNYFGLRTLERSHLLKINGKIVERPQHMLMRVAIGLHGDDIGSVIKSYNILSERYFAHAPSTLLAAAINRAQLSSSFLLLKRGGHKEEVHFDKITSRIQKLCYGLNMDFVDPVAITLKVINGLYCGVTTQELDNLAAETAASLTANHGDYAVLAARIAVSNLHKETKKVFSEVISDLYHYVNKGTGKSSPLISEYYYEVVKKNADRLNSSIIYDRDFAYNYFGFKTLERSYLLKINGKIVERPQHMLMRVAIGIHGDDIDSAIESYNLLSERYFTHASPTLFAAATSRAQLSSCFLLTMVDDSIEGIFKSVEQCALISKSAGGIGLNVHCIRAKGTSIDGTNGISNGLVPMLRLFNNVACYVNQGGGKRPGAFAIYLEPWHADIFEFLVLKKNTGKEEHRARDLFYALWIPDLFMKRVEENGVWSLMCPHKCPGLQDVWGEKFEELYTKYEQDGKANRTVKAQDLWFAIIEAQVETGTPYMLYKDACNRKSNQQNVGTIKCSNLCTEIVEYSSPDEIAVCNLASIALNMYVTPEKTFDFKKLKQVTKVITKNLNKIIDINYYPLAEAKKSNLRHRPIGIGVQGFADALILMRFPYESQEAALLNQQIFETIYYGALEASNELAEKLGPYETYAGSPVSKGILQYDMWNKTPTDLWNWSDLKEKIKQHGVRNSLLLAPMPTASTAQILGNNESFEPYTSNIYTRRVLSGEFYVVNNHLLKDLTELDLWDDVMKNQIIFNRGSIQAIESIPKNIRELYKTVWEISVKTTIKMAADRGAFIDQSQSFNIHVAEPNYGKLTSIHFYSWKSGLKTGMYYLRTKPAANAIQFTVDKRQVSNLNESQVKSYVSDEERNHNETSTQNNGTYREKRMAEMVCSLENKEDCLSCGS